MRQSLQPRTRSASPPLSLSAPTRCRTRQAVSGTPVSQSPILALSRHGSDCRMRTKRQTADPLCRRRESLTNYDGSVAAPLWMPQPRHCAARNSRALSGHRSVTRVTAKRRGPPTPMKRAALYVRVSSPDQHIETQLCDLRPLAAAGGFEIVGEYSDTTSGSKAKGPGLDQLMFDARRGKFDVVMVWAFDRMARSVRHFLEVLDELNHLNIEFVSFRENLDTGGALGRAMIIIVGAISVLERSLIIERVNKWHASCTIRGKTNWTSEARCQSGASRHRPSHRDVANCRST